MKVKFFLLPIFLLLVFVNSSLPQRTDVEQLRSRIAEHNKTSDKQVTGRVVSVSDGDTVTVLNAANTQFKIRLEGIDAPESKQDFGQRSKQHLSDLIFDKEVTVIIGKTDKYGRSVGKILLENVDVNLEQIKAGLAWHYKKYAVEQSESDQKLYAIEEAKAKKAIIGLWTMPDPTAPWNWRTGENNANLDGIPKNAVIGNNNSMIYHLSGCSGYAKVSRQNQVIFESAEEAETEGYRRAKNCRNASSNKSTKASTAIPKKSPSTPRIKTTRTYIRGSRGGCYYINSRGNKTYVARGLCN